MNIELSKADIVELRYVCKILYRMELDKGHYQDADRCHRLMALFDLAKTTESKEGVKHEN